jgi:hypothetical protein
LPSAVAPGVPRGTSTNEKFSSRAPAAPIVPEQSVSQTDNEPPGSEKFTAAQWQERHEAAFEARVAAARVSLNLRRMKNREPSGIAVDNICFFE